MLETRVATEQSGLSDSQIGQFWQDGFIFMNDVFSEEEVMQLREACLAPEIVQQSERDGQQERTIHYLAVTAKHPAFLELCRNPAIVEKVNCLIGSNIQLQHSKLAAQATTKGKGGFGWHQDFAFFPHTNTDLVAVMIMLDDATPDNGCMSMVRGSHKLGLLNHYVDGKFTGVCQETEAIEADPNKITAITPKMGGISIHHCLSLHGSGANISGRPRQGIVFQYRADDAYQLISNTFTDTGLMVSGERGEQVRLTEAIYHLPPRSAWKKSDEVSGTAWNQEGDFAREQNARHSPL